MGGGEVGCYFILKKDEGVDFWREMGGIWIKE